MITNKIIHYFLSLVSIIALTYCSPTAKNKKEEPGKENTFHPSKGSIEIIDPAFKKMINEDASIDVLGEGFMWTEGPVWIPEEDYLLFCDIPKNTIHKWKEGEGISVYLTPSGYTGEKERGGETGSNGLMLNAEKQLFLCQHGNRQIAVMNAELSDPKPDFITLSDGYDGKKLNSPNDLAVHSGGDIYFTDPPYGLEFNVKDPLKEIDFQGVYRWSAKDSTTTLMFQDLTRPNGIALSPDEKYVYVANSDPKKAYWIVFDLTEEGSFANGRIFYDATTSVAESPGLPDGMAVDKSGNLFATGPGGVWIFSPQGKLLGKIKTGQATANCTFSADYKYLYMTAHSYLLRVKL
ncbi:SMP-30/gluconolactonase/LRE family protein [Reichenbachiella sp. MALMAid0571]|uniref:SMP-30/gluconolactonase/LRE family protein n=1 Tax=Reichenbachiella sp. MALMAid0571 TaxID=3143939 RepID=UPI0032DEC3F1